MLEMSVEKTVDVKSSPEPVEQADQDAIVFMRDFENTDLSAKQRLEALKMLVRLLK